MDEILAGCTHPALVRCLFSATLPPVVEELLRTVMHDPVRIVIGQRCVAGRAPGMVAHALVFYGLMARGAWHVAVARVRSVTPLRKRFSNGSCLLAASRANCWRSAS